ncbi:EMC3/TMCO1 family protein [Haloarculaceae archaeon H-GB11]|nr:EMC3/TMCO1 family protein [Haloarculaceae archaeon H-GB11]
MGGRRRLLDEAQWGRLVGSDLFVQCSDGRYVLADTERVRTLLEEPPESPIEDDAGWSTRDKLVGLCTLGLFAGYYADTIRSVIAGAVDVLLGSFAASVPFYCVVFVLAVATSTYSSILRGVLTDSEKLVAYKARMNAIESWKDEVEERGDEDALSRATSAQLRSLADLFGILREQFRPVAWMLVLTIPSLLWLRWLVGTGAVGGGPDPVFVMPLVGPISSWSQTVFGVFPAWLLLYGLFSMVTSKVVEASLDLETDGE